MGKNKIKTKRATLPDENYQAINTHGFEVELGYDGKRGLRGMPFDYYVRGNFSFATNEILQLNEAQNIRAYQSRVGRSTTPASSCFGYVATNVIRTPDDLAALPAGYTINGLTPKLGMLNYADLRGPTSDDPDGKITSDDQQWLCNYDQDNPPKHFGLSLGGSWNGFKLSTLVQGSAGGQIMLTTNGRDLQARAEESSYAFWADTWTPDNPDGKYPGWRDTGYRTRYPVSSFWLRDASFVRLKNVTVSYDLPPRLVGALGANGARLYFTGTNLALLYDQMGDWGYDPEMDDIRAYPLMRTFSLGMNLTLGRNAR